jgi:dihydropteroate synthase
VPISVDTYKEQVAKCALDAGASIINNIMGVKVKKSFLRIVRRYNAAIILMHIRGIPKTMQKNIRYKDLISEILLELKNSIEKCLEIGIKSDKIIIDPGIGFGKTPEHNIQILQRLSEFKILNQPLLIGTSRKSFIGNILKKDVSQRLMGTAASVSVGILKGAHIVRVHDVKEMRQIVTMTDTILNAHVRKNINNTMAMIDPSLEIEK